MHVSEFEMKSWNTLKSSNSIVKREEWPYGAYGGCSFFTDISRLNRVSSQYGTRYSKENTNSIQFSFLFSLHVQPINIIYLMKTDSTILRDASIHKSAFYCHHNTVWEITVWFAFGTSQVGHKP